MRSTFISHCQPDTEFARRLSADLWSAGYGARSFADVVPPTERLSETQLDKRLDDAISSDTFFVPILTQAAVQSRWVDRELAAAIEAESKKDQVKIVPVLA
jgi:hypothetical protein